MKAAGFVPNWATAARHLWFFEGKAEAPAGSPQIDSNHPALVRWREIMEDPRGCETQAISDALLTVWTDVPGQRRPPEYMIDAISRMTIEGILPPMSGLLGSLVAGCNRELLQKLGLEPWKRGSDDA